MSKEDSKFERIGLGPFNKTASQEPRSIFIDPEDVQTIGPISANDECTTVIIV